MAERTGGCQCGRVRYRMLGEPFSVVACHCTECQRQSGSAFGMSMIIRATDFVLESGELKLFERTAESGRTLGCAFCPECGTRIYHVPSYLQGVLNLKPGTLDDTSWLKPGFHSWVRSRQSWLVVPADVPQHPTQPM